MKGQYAIMVQNNFIQFKFEIRRNITIIKGDSATGKTTLVDMIREYYENGEQSGITLNCAKVCAVLEGRQWKVLLDSIHDSIVFIDEGNAFIFTDEFSNAVKQSDNYYVIVTREALPNLPYSVEEVYGIKSSGKFGSLQQTYQEFYQIYGGVELNTEFCPEVVLVEDSNAGYEFFHHVGKNKNWQAVSAGGKSNIFRLLKEYENRKVLIIADGAAFGSEMDRIMKRLNQTDKIGIYLPESFEWLILKANILKDKEVRLILDNPGEYIESRAYMSWERFFTAVLVEKTRGTYLEYTKNKLNEAYANSKVQSEILEKIPENLL